MIGAGAGPSRSFSYANAGAAADNAMADAKVIVTIFFTVRLRCLLMQDGCLAGAACDANARHTQGVAYHKIRPFVHANVMAVVARKRNDWQSTTRRALLDEMTDVDLRRHSRTAQLPCAKRLRDDGYTQFIFI
jgi:hypothetical protein